MNHSNDNGILSTISRILFYITLLAYFIINTAKYSSMRYSIENYNPMLRQLLWICCGVALFNVIFLCRYNWKHFLLIVLCLGLFGYVYYQTECQDYLLIQSAAVLFSGRHANWNTIVKFSFWAWILVTLTTFALNFAGIAPTLEVYRGEKLRYNLGLAHPNGVGLYMICFVFLWVLLRFKKLKFYDYIAWIALALFTWFVPNSKTGTCSILLLCVVTFIIQMWGEKLLQFRIIQGLCICSFPIMGIFSYFASYFYDAGNALYNQIDLTCFTTRLSLAHYMIQTYPVTLFGQKLQLIGSVKAAMKGVPAQILDNFYVRVLLNDGVIVLIIIMAIMMFLTYKAIERKDYGTLIVILISSVYCIYEFHHTELMYNICLLQTVSLLFGPIFPLSDEADIQKDTEEKQSTVSRRHGSRSRRRRRHTA